MSGILRVHFMLNIAVLRRLALQHKLMTDPRRLVVMLFLRRRLLMVAIFVMQR